MAKNNSKGSYYTPKKTKQGNGLYSKTPHAGGETYYGDLRAGSPPNKARNRKKAYRGQGR
jgi:hypothetical protein